jgi:hypothetical protein
MFIYNKYENITQIIIIEFKRRHWNGFQISIISIHILMRSKCPFWRFWRHPLFITDCYKDRADPTMKCAPSKVFIRPWESATQLCRNFDLDNDLDG